MAPVRGLKVDVGVGDIFKWAKDTHALAHCVGADMAMTAGIAVEFKQRFGNQAYLLGLGKSVGQVATLPAQLAGRQAPVFYLVTKKVSTDYSPQWEDFLSCLQELRRLCEEGGICNVSMPQIGCGLDHLSWEKVYTALEEVFKPSKTRLMVFKHKPGVFCPPVLDLEPTYRGFQLVGDSQLVRFGIQYGDYHQQPRQRYPRQLGLCVSGQTIPGLTSQVSMCNVSNNIVCMIGTNDLLIYMKAADNLKKRSRYTIRGNLMHLVKVLTLRGATRIVMVAVPFLPGCEGSTDAVKNINEFISHVTGNVKFADLSPRLLLPNGRPNMSLYEEFMGPEANRREDGIHLNRDGLRVLKECLDEAILSFVD